MNVLISPDKFKGTLTAGAAAEAIARGWQRARPTDSLVLLPMSDGGDGFGEVLGQLLGAKIQKVKTVDAAHRPCEANWWWEPKTKTAVIESANVIGLAKLPPGKFHPFELDTFGLGAVIRAAAKKGARRCLIGIGGSATNDGGFGMARALGWKFWDRADAPIERWTELDRLARVSRPACTRWFEDLIVAVDVRNPLLGVRGATRVYGPQKGLREEDFAAAERNLRNLADAVARFVVPPSTVAMQLFSLGSAAASAAVRREARRTKRRAEAPNGESISSVSVSREARLTAPEAGALPKSNCIVTALAGPDRLKPELRTRAGAGAAGGLGFGLMAFAGAQAEPGFELFARLAKLEKLLRAADWVITGEGCIDESTFMGKGVGEIARHCRKIKIPCLAFAGNLTARTTANRFFAEAHALSELTTITKAKSKPAAWLEKLVQRTACGRHFNFEKSRNTRALQSRRDLRK